MTPRKQSATARKKVPKAQPPSARVRAYLASLPPDARRHLRKLRDAIREWYRRLGHAVLEETDEYLLTEGGFRSEHFSDARLRGLIGDCIIRPVTDIARAVTF